MARSNRGDDDIDVPAEWYRFGRISFWLLIASLALNLIAFFATGRILTADCPGALAWIPAFIFFVAGVAGVVSAGVGIRALRRPLRDGRGWWGAVFGLPAGFAGMVLFLIAAIASQQCGQA